jgi:hypothetical protein
MGLIARIITKWLVSIVYKHTDHIRKCTVYVHGAALFPRLQLRS